METNKKDSNETTNYVNYYKVEHRITCPKSKTISNKLLNSTLLRKRTKCLELFLAPALLVAFARPYNGLEGIYKMSRNSPFHFHSGTKAAICKFKKKIKMYN